MLLSLVNIATTAYVYDMQNFDRLTQMTYKLHLDNPEHGLLTRHGGKALLNCAGIDDCYAVLDRHEEIIRQSIGHTGAVCLYFIGVMQGIHNERQRRIAHE